MLENRPLILPLHTLSKSTLKQPTKFIDIVKIHEDLPGLSVARLIALHRSAAPNPPLGGIGRKCNVDGKTTEQKELSLSSHEFG